MTCHADGDFAGTVERVERWGSAGLTGAVGLLGGLANLEWLRLMSTGVSGNIASLSGLANLLLLTIQNSYIYGDTAAVTVSNTFAFTPCADLGGCGAGTLVASPSTYAGRTQAVCCGTATCAGNADEGGGRTQPDFACPFGSPISSP